ncbi:MAG: 4-cresol dehydrogenase (hydroxylating) flavoprotein subunit [Bryobacterales bacterium]|jgi:4-cresol dehydrogenase (hydroxylating)|nr:4-cresol dehydrogenase (hydroxylating) flavoprotein subunit [Bryobacterales bacterium]
MRNRNSCVADALLEWAGAIGPEFVVSGSAELRAAETATFQTTQRIPVILRPGTPQEACEVVRIANHHGTAVYPVSSGKNWGYGSRVPVTTDCVLLDLSRLNRITDFNERLGYITVEPGVTQQDLFNFLRERNSKLWMDATGSSPDCSLIGNAMERGFGHTPYGDHFSNICGLEVILASGEVIRTGYAGLPAAKAGPVYRWGVGPSLDGLFSQSNLGIVIGMTIWLMPAPEYFQSFFFQCDREDGLAPIVDALRPLRMDGTLRSAVHIGNDYKVLAGICQFPWEEELPLSPERMKVQRAKAKFARWSGSGALYGTRNQVAEARKLLRRALAGKTDKLQFLDDRKLSLASRFKGVYKTLSGLDLTRTLQLLRPVYGLLKGIPTRATLGSTYWRKRMAVPADPDPDRDGCGLLWTAPVAPMEGHAARTLIGMAERTLLAHGFEPQISLTLLTERSLACVISITYDREVPGEDGKAMAAYIDLQTQLEREGYYSYRLGIAGMRTLNSNPAYGQLLRDLKRALDPGNVIAPGRYIPGENIGAARA